MWTLAVAALSTLPLAWPLRRRDTGRGRTRRQRRARPSIGAARAVGVALRDPQLLVPAPRLLHLRLSHRLPGDAPARRVALCGLSPRSSAISLALIGLFNIAGSLGAGWLGQRYRMKHLLALMYASRAALIAIYLLRRRRRDLLPVRGGLGLTWLATVPPTAGLVGKLFGAALPGHAVRADPAVAPDRRLLRRVARRPGDRTFRRLHLDVVRRHRAGAAGGGRQPADPRIEAGAAARSCTGVGRNAYHGRWGHRTRAVGVDLGGGRVADDPADAGLTQARRRSRNSRTGRALPASAPAA